MTNRKDQFENNVRSVLEKKTELAAAIKNVGPLAPSVELRLKEALAVIEFHFRDLYNHSRKIDY